ncbi:hypothetical protein NIES4074_48380 [Cylindrospermum sp. NIES-4074]|nr:hypothetical protein NIES4074_48380 [Cylindrospermum sp. NIES-4074]
MSINDDQIYKTDLLALANAQKIEFTLFNDTQEPVLFT